MALTKTDIDDLEMLIHINENIFDIYRELTSLDCSGALGTKEFDEKLDTLKKWIEMLNNGLDRLSDNYEKNKELMDYLIGKAEMKMTKKGIFTFCTFLHLNKKDLVLYGIYNRLFKKIIDFEDEAILEVALMHGNEELCEHEDFRKSILFQFCLSNYLISDTVQICLVLLSLLSKTTMEQFYAVSFKYYYAMLYPEVEKLFLSSKFALLEHPFLIHGMAKTIYGIRSEEAALMIKEFMSQFLSQYVDLLLGFSDKNLISAQDCMLVNHYLCDFRAKLVLLDEESLGKFHEKTETILNSCDKPNKELLKQAIRDAFKAVDMDRSIPYVTTLDF